jgi:BirA family biotin operon repressor/biotin-[acetyl-CoA-carboxylase] ligase
VDVNLNPTDFPPELRKLATSLKIESGKAVPRAELAVAILHELDEVYDRLRRGEFAQIADEWEEHCSTLGHDTVIRIGARQVRGRAEALGEDGALLLRTDHGRLEQITGGDLTVES